MSFVYFTDRDLGLRFPQILRDAGFAVERHRDHFRPDAPDEEWLEVAGRRGWVALTHNSRIRYTPNEKEAVFRHAVRLLVIVGQAPYPDLAKSFAATRERIEAFLEQHTPPFIAKVYRPSPAEVAKNPWCPGESSAGCDSPVIRRTLRPRPPAICSAPQSKRGEAMRPVLGLCFAFLFATGVAAQSAVVLELDDVTDNRVSSGDPNGFQVQGGLELRVTVNGKNLDKAAAARVIVKEAKDDKGNSLLGDKPTVPDFMPREYNSGTLQFGVGQPARNATSVRLKGTIELYVPSRDPSANVKIDNALAALDKPLSSKALKAAKLEITPLSRDGYAAAMKARKITDKDIEQIRAEGKKRGAPENEIELAIKMAQAFESMDADVSENAVILSGDKGDFDQIYRIEILGDDGEPINITSRGTSSRGESSLMTLNPSQPLPEKATVQLMLLTDKTRMSFPFDLKVPLP